MHSRAARYEEDSMCSTILKGTALAVLCLAAAWGQTTPNFTGNWKPNLSKSDTGPMPASENVMKVDHKDPQLKIQVTMPTPDGEQPTEMNYRTDGVETENHFGPMTLKGKGHFEGETLVIESKGDMGGDTMTIKEKWALSDGGKTLTIERSMSSPMGDMTLKIVHEKQ
jgi:hypothetical protein